MNEHNNFTPEELNLYRSALDEAYPAPKSDIHGNVMKAIRAERILKKQRARRALFVKWGSVAACLAIVCLVGWRVIPGTDKFAPMEANKADRAYDLAEDYVVSACDNSDDGLNYGGYSAEVESPAGYSVDPNVPTTYTYSDSTKCGDTTVSYVPGAVGTECAPETCETEETEETEEAPETVAEVK